MKEDFNALRLKHHGDAVKMNEILQKECRYKCRSKLPETLRCEDFIFPSLAVAEMATSDAVAQIHAQMIEKGEKVLDMTCGLGIDAFHLAEKAEQVVAVELDNRTFECALHNATALGVKNCRVVHGDSLEFLRKCGKRFDTIFIDPARRDSSGRHFSLAECHPDVPANIDFLLSHCKRLIIKASPMADIQACCRELKGVIKVVVIGTVKECKESVIVCASETQSDNTKKSLEIVCETIGRGSFSFTTDEEKINAPIYCNERLKEGGYLFLPYPAIMKAGPFAVLSRRLLMPMLHPNTRLYYSESHKQEFPGECFGIESIFPFNKKSVKEFGSLYPKINVAVRNFPLSAPELAKRLKIKEGGEKIVFGATGPNDEKLLIVGEPLK